MCDSWSRLFTYLYIVLAVQLRFSEFRRGIHLDYKLFCCYQELFRIPESSPFCSISTVNRWVSETEPQKGRKCFTCGRRHSNNVLTSLGSSAALASDRTKKKHKHTQTDSLLKSLYYSKDKNKFNNRTF